MPTVIEDLRDGLRAREVVGDIQMERTFYVADLTLPEGATAEAARFMSALALDEIPAIGDSFTYDGNELFVVERSLKPSPPADAEVTIVYGLADYAIPEGEEWGKARVTGGTMTERTESEFDSANLALPFASRTPIFVDWDPSSSGAPGANKLPPQGGRVPIFLANSVVSFQRLENTDPSERSRLFGSKTNATTWFGLDAGTVLCTGATFRQLTNGLYESTYSFCWKPEGWKQYLRYTDQISGRPPKLTNAQLAASNGVSEITVQGSAEFADLAIVVL